MTEILVEKIKNTYLDNFEKLKFKNKFHFLSRLFLWSGDVESKKALGLLLRDYNFDQVYEIYTQEKNSSFNINNHKEGLRSKYFEKYPDINKYNRLLYLLMMYENIFQLKQKELFAKYFNRHKVEQLYDSLIKDPSALVFLSTYAINFIYFYKAWFCGEDEPLNISFVKDEVNKVNDLADNENIKLCLYLYTHIIIGESRFYYKKIEPLRKGELINIIYLLENIIKEKYAEISLDNKLEFLVCCKLLEYKSNLESQISIEALNSYDKEKGYLICKNNDKSLLINNFNSSEHRNVLYIMSQTSFQPNS
ncbi:hypothetical protein KBD45_06955 [Candidatus Dojkabacteria bacterium]|nr:hypothetical protein [Candidatus Dojkabacteria bacterium]